MKNTVVIVTDLGSFKAYKLDRTPIKQTPRLELLQELEAVDAHGKMSEKVTDQAGRWRVPTSRMAMSYGDRHNLDLELRKRLIKQLAQHINGLLKNNGVEECLLSASKEMHHQLLDELDPGARAKIVKIVPADLTKIDKSELLQHFAPQL